MKTFISIALVAALMSFSNIDAVLAQAGSTGGSIGKQDKSISGGEDAAPVRRPAKAAKPRDTGSRSPRSASIAGIWRWWADCEKNVRHFEGTITFVQVGGLYSGTHGGTNIFDSGTISNIRVGGGRVSFTRQYGQYVDNLNMRLSGPSMHGVLPNTEYSGRCDVFGSKM